MNLTPCENCRAVPAKKCYLKCKTRVTGYFGNSRNSAISLNRIIRYFWAGLLRFRIRHWNEKMWKKVATWYKQLLTWWNLFHKTWGLFFSNKARFRLKSNSRFKTTFQRFLFTCVSTCWRLPLTIVAVNVFLSFSYTSEAIKRIHLWQKYVHVRS